MNAAASTATTIHVSISGVTAEDVLRSARELGGTTALSSISNDDLLAELRDRFAKTVPPMVVRVELFESNGAATDAKQEAKQEPANKKPTAAEKAAAKAATDAALKEAADKAAATKAAGKETPKDTVAGTQTAGDAGGGDWDDGADTSTAPSVDDVKAALNACSAAKGQAATREIMKEVGGSMRLLDVPAEKYADLIAKLNEAA